MNMEASQFLTEHKEKIVLAMDILQKGCEVLSHVVEEVFPVVSMIAPFVELAMGTVESAETKYVKEQLSQVKDTLSDISEQVKDINRELEKSFIDIKYFKIEVRFELLFDKLMDISKAKPGSTKVQERFLDAYKYGEKSVEDNLEILYNDIMGKDKESILETAMNYMKRDRRALEKYFTYLLQLMYFGVIVTMAYKTLTKEPYKVFEENWRSKIMEVQTKMKELIDECINSFAEQARIDMQLCIRKRGDKNNHDLVEELLDLLKSKYDWVSWFVCAVEINTSFYSCFCNASYHHEIGCNILTFPEDSGSVVVASYSSQPKNIDKLKIQQIMKKRMKNHAEAIATTIHDDLPGHVVLIVRQNKDCDYVYSFTDDTFYLGNYKQYSVCIHSE